MLFKMEAKKAIKSTGFKVSIIVSSIIVILQSLWFYKNVRMVNLDEYNYFMNQKGNCLWYENSIFEGWIGIEGFSMFGTLVFVLMPLIACMPYCLSFYDEWKTKYTEHVLIKRSKKEFLVTKYVVTFASGGIAASYPFLLSLFISALYLPVIKPDIRALSIGITDRSLGAQLYDKSIFLYLTFFIVLEFIYGGIFAVTSMAASKWIDNRFTIMLLPTAVTGFLYYVVFRMNLNWSKFLYPVFIKPEPGITSEFSFGVVIAETLLFLIATFGVYFLSNIKRETIN